MNLSHSSVGLVLSFSKSCNYEFHIIMLNTERVQSEQTIFIRENAQNLIRDDCDLINYFR